jgi:hypothetical protein
MQDMDGVNYIRHQKEFYSHVRKDDRLKANDISLYLALFQIWNDHHFGTWFPVIREEVMLLSGIGSRNTYGICLKWLQECGYIIYQPSNRPYVPSIISILPFGEKNTNQLSLFEQPKSTKKTRLKNNQTVVDLKTEPHNKLKIDTHAKLKNEPHTCPKNEPNTVPKLGHNYINKQINNKTESKGTLTQKKIKSNEKEIPTIEAAAEWFAQKGHPAQEARRFFYHYQAINWTLSGQPISDWQAAAAKWTENIKIIHDHKPGNLHTDDSKTYTHPL